jgi:hypothetical protein
MDFEAFHQVLRARLSQLLRTAQVYSGWPVYVENLHGLEVALL